MTSLFKDDDDPFQKAAAAATYSHDTGSNSDSDSPWQAKDRAEESRQPAEQQHRQDSIKAIQRLERKLAKLKKRRGVNSSSSYDPDRYHNEEVMDTSQDDEGRYLLANDDDDYRSKFEQQYTWQGTLLSWVPHWCSCCFGRHT
ncbi:hypothetical protein VTP01DRAFT_1380 [Rhizomucor pusillus]|uniref:uncharacterized protein n=1 Tax=Rhizomucor pusillus TaxID=4840 RepID=UPI003743EE53